MIASTPYHPMTQGKIEGSHCSKKNVVKPRTFRFPSDLENNIEAFVSCNKNDRYCESLNNLTPADVYFGRAEEVKDKREEIKQKTLQQRRQLNRQMTPNALSLEWRILS
jgi:putative transposase